MGQPLLFSRWTTQTGRLSRSAIALTVPSRSFKIWFPAEVAQVVEHGTENAGVDSSSLSLGTFLLPSPRPRYKLAARTARRGRFFRFCRRGLREATWQRGFHLDRYVEGDTG